MKNKYHIQLVEGAVDEINPPPQTKVRTNLSLEFTKKEIAKMQKAVGLKGKYPENLIIQSYLKRALYDI